MHCCLRAKHNRAAGVPDRWLEEAGEGELIEPDKGLPAQPVDATQALNRSAGVSNSSV